VVHAERSTVTLRASSTLHQITRTVPVTGHLDATITDRRLDPSDPVEGRLELPLELLKAGDAYDGEIQRRLDAQRYPLAVAQLRSASSAAGGHGQYTMTGDLSLHGRTVAVEGRAQVDCDGDRLILRGSLSFDLREFGIKPPKILLLRMHPEVRAELSMVAHLSV
jgi:polyisoprenoid-binding protein YceI